MTCQEGIKDFNRTSLNIKKYIIGKEKEELLTLGRSFVDIKYIVNESIRQASNNNDEENNSNSNKSDSISTNYTKINKDSENSKYNKEIKLRNNIINNNFDTNLKIVIKNTFNKNGQNNHKNKEEIKKSLIKEGRPSRRSITSHDIERLKEKIKTKDDPYIDHKKIPKKKDSNKLIRNNLLIAKGNNIPSINSIREINKMENNKKVYPIIEKDKNTFLSQQFQNNSIKNLDSPKNQIEENNINNEKNDSLEIINYLELNKQKINNNNIEISEEMKIYDTFCIGVFVSGISPPIKNNSIIENSEFFIAPCGHLQCSLFPSLQPQ